MVATRRTKKTRAQKADDKSVPVEPSPTPTRNRRVKHAAVKGGRSKRKTAPVDPIPTYSDPVQNPSESQPADPEVVQQSPTKFVADSPPVVKESEAEKEQYESQGKDETQQEEGNKAETQGESPDVHAPKDLFEELDEDEILLSDLGKRKRPISPPAETKSVRTEKKMKKKEVKEKDKSVIQNGVWFCNKTAASRWKIVQERKVIQEKKLDIKKFGVPEVIRDIVNSGLIGTVQMAKPFDEQLVRELVGNITVQFLNNKHEDYGVVRVRGQVIRFSPSLINEFFETGDTDNIEDEFDMDWVAKEISAGVETSWKGKVMPSNLLSTKHAILHGICLRNWLPSMHRTTISKTMACFILQIAKGVKLDIGTYIFKQLGGHAHTDLINYPICCPSLLYEVTIGQCPELALGMNIMSAAPTTFLADWKVYSGKHTVDVTIPVSVQTALRKNSVESKRGKAVSQNLKDDMIKKLKKDMEFFELIISRAKTELKLTKQLLRDIEYPLEDESDEAEGDEDDNEAEE